MLYYCKNIIFYFQNHISIYQISCTRLHDFQYDTYKYAMNKVDCDVIALWKNYRPSHVTNDNCNKFQEFMTSNGFRRHLGSRSQNKNRETHVYKKLGFELGMDIGLLDLQLTQP